ncbi:flagellar hook-length control protein FliK [Desulfovibrio sp. ZJ369]|uniref:flagellar hook-length control protein FliK n=1 Tax=Desulfovibrio sp. ZJ369 TaxID=2709793 RepID=UPI0013EE2258|nr:flagellar hook-length control protein FliK [Desulfovibrio sp. ZJ369]
MQIIPASSAGFGSDLWSNAAQSSQGDSPYADFLQSIHEAIESVQRGQSGSVDTALADSGEQARPLVQGPYSRNSVDGVTYTLDEVCFTKNELFELRRELIKVGAPAQSLKKFDVLADQPDGATLAQVMASLQAYGDPSDLSDEDLTNITALLGKIDPTGDLSAQALQLMRDGNGSAALALISETFASLASAEGIEISRDEALALGRGLGLNQNSLQTLANSFGNQQTLIGTSAQFAHLMAPAAAQFAEEAAQRQKLDAALEQTLKPIISKARNRMEKEKAAAALRNREVEQSKILINRTVEKKSREILDQTLQSGRESANPNDAEARDEAISRKLDQSQSAALGDAGTSEKNNRAQTAEVSARAASNAESAANSRNNPGVEHADFVQSGHSAQSKTGYVAGLGNEGAHGEARPGSEQGTSREWSELLHKIEANAAQPAGSNGNSVLFSMLQGNAESSATLENMPGANSRTLSRHVAQQVEQGLLTALKGGGARLDLQLHPQELGAITITLTARNGEVSARIRSEKTETAEMVTRQLDAIRINLEQQGIKVDKIEVQLENRQQDDHSQWQDLDQHNSWQEEEARREELARLKNLSAMRNSSRNMEIEHLEQPVHSLGQTAGYSTRALHVVA